MTSPPSTPSRAPYLSHSASSHSHSSPNLLTPSSSLGQRSDYRSGSSTRPSTPLNVFPLALPSQSVEMQGNNSTLSSSSSFSITHTAHAFDGVPRPDVDPAIKGVAQGWEDDPSIPVTIAPTPTSISTGRTPFPDPRSKSTIRYGLKSTSDTHHHSRLNSFRGLASGGETRSKLSSWRDKTFPELVESRKKRAEAGRPGVGPGTVGRSGGPGLPPSDTPRISMDTTSIPATSLPTRLGVSVAPHSQATSTTTHTVAASDEDFGDLFTGKLPTSRPSPISRPSFGSGSTSASGPAGHDADRQSMLSTGSTASTRNRERVMGVVSDTSRPVPGSGRRLFLPPDVNDVLPFASSRLYSAWDHPQSQSDIAGMSSISPVKANVRTVKGRRTSMSLSNRSGNDQGRVGSLSTESGLVISRGGTEEAMEGWKDLPKSLSGGQKRVWIGPEGQQVASVYRVGWEKEVMDVEARLHEAMYDLAGERHTFVSLPDGHGPKTILDIGTGLGLWPVSQAQIWRETQFVGLDIVPCQLDLAALASAERISRSSSTGVPAEEGLWAGIEKRVTWDQADFLTTLPYDTGVFDMVHLRFLSLGLSESAWPAFLDEALRVLAPGGHIEIVDLSVVLPPSSPASLQRSFASMLLAEMINPDPSLPIQFALPMLDGLQSGIDRPVFEGSEEGVFAEAGWAWVRSALEYKGKGMEKAGGKDVGLVRRIKRSLGPLGGLCSWDERVEKGERPKVEQISLGGAGNQGALEVPRIWAWVGRKKT